MMTSEFYLGKGLNGERMIIVVEPAGDKFNTFFMVQKANEQVSGETLDVFKRLYNAVKLG